MAKTIRTGSLALAAKPGRFIAAVLIVAAVAGCSGQITSGAHPTDTFAGATGTPASTDSAGAPPTLAATGTAALAATGTAAPTATATAAPTTASTAKATAVPTPLPPLAVGLCKSGQLKLVITLWEGGSGTSYAHVTATNKSGATCNMRGSSEARIVDARGRIIGDAGAGAAKVSSGDPTYALAPAGQISTIIQWANWCKSAPLQKVTVAMVEPFGLGGFVANALGDAPVPTCYASSQPVQVSSEAWMP